MSGDNRDAQRVFDAGVLSLGIPIDGLEVERGHPVRRGWHSDGQPNTTPTCATPGSAAPPLVRPPPEVIHHLYRTSTWLGREQRRLGLAPRTLSARFETGLYLDYTLSSLTEVWLAYAASLIQGRDYGEAEQTLDELAAMRTRDAATTRPATRSAPTFAAFCTSRLSGGPMC